MLGYCQSAASATVAESAPIEAGMAPSLLLCHGSYGLTINGRLLADHINYTRWSVETTSEVASFPGPARSSLA